MISFADPWLLALALLVPPLVWWWQRRRRGALRYPGAGALPRLPPGRTRVSRWGSMGLRTAALLLLVVSLAGPRWPDLHSRIPTEGIAIVMVVDVSGSMSEPDFELDGKSISRLDAVKIVFGRFVAGGQLANGEQLDGRAGDLIGLVSFASRPECPCPLTLSHSVLVRMLGEERPRTGDEARTNISDALVRALVLIKDAKPRRKVLVLLSDGEHNFTKEETRSQLTPREAAQIAGNLGITIHSIDAGGNGPGGNEPGAKEPSAEIRADGIRTLREVAHITHGEYFQARDTETLLQVCRKIDSLERDPIESPQYRRYHEAYPWFGLGSFVCLIAVSILEATFWRRVP
jgi:Ca-activated chloride channel family protein